MAIVRDLSGNSGPTPNHVDAEIPSQLKLLTDIEQNLEVNEAILIDIETNTTPA